MAQLLNVIALSNTNKICYISVLDRYKSISLSQLSSRILVFFYYSHVLPLSRSHMFLVIAIVLNLTPWGSPNIGFYVKRCEAESWSLKYLISNNVCWEHLLHWCDRNARIFVRITIQISFLQDEKVSSKLRGKQAQPTYDCEFLLI